MRCLNSSCNYAKTQVINSRKTRQGRGVLRRRHCPKCNRRYTSIEMLAYFDYLKQKRAAIDFLCTYSFLIL